MKVNKDKRICFRLENNDFKVVSKLALQENKSISQILREHIKEIIKNMGA